MKGCLIKRNLIESLKYSEDFKENNQIKCNVTLRIFAQLLANDLNYILNNFGIFLSHYYQWHYFTTW